MEDGTTVNIADELFTFHYVSINMLLSAGRLIMISFFTFHYVSINIQQDPSFAVNVEAFTFHYVSINIRSFLILLSYTF